MYICVPVSNFESNSSEERYLKLVTPYAFYFIEKQLNLAKTVEVLNLNVENTLEYIVTSTVNCELFVTRSDCSCAFRKDMKMPCKHIFAVREKIKLPLYREELVDRRFQRSYYIKSHSNESLLDITSNIENRPYKLSKIERHVNVSTQQQKYKVTMNVCHNLATVISECGTKKNRLYMKAINDLIDMSNQQRDVMVAEVVKSVSVGTFICFC